jgi:hypothetical protein
MATKFKKVRSASAEPNGRTTVTYKDGSVLRLGIWPYLREQKIKPWEHEQ